LERFKVRHGNYPANLRELQPDFLKDAPVDFMDGQPLRYELASDGRFVLYSTGLDCVDNGGRIPRPKSPEFSNPRLASFARPMTPGDLVWPKAASSNEIASLHEQELEERRQQADQEQEMETERYWDRTTRHQANVEAILGSASPTPHDRDFNGRPLS